MAPLEERDPQATHDLRRTLSRAGAWLFAVGLLTGLWAGVVLTGKVQVAHPRLALGAHLTGMLGGLLALCGGVVARSVALRRARSAAAGMVDRRFRVGELVDHAGGLRLGVRGLEYTWDPVNNTIAALLDLFVVLPALVGAFAWAWGFGGRR